jgi:hypothetical protein
MLTEILYENEMQLCFSYLFSGSSGTMQPGQDGVAGRCLVAERGIPGAG